MRPRSLLDDATLAAAVRRLEDAATTRRACPPVRDLIGADDACAAYAVQHRMAGARIAAGARRVGRKIGLTSEAVQRQLGVDQPDFGTLFEDMRYADGDSIPVERFLQPRVEAEVAFVLGLDLDNAELDLNQLTAAVEYVAPALEIVDSRIDNWDITFGDTVADNGSSGAFVLGTAEAALADVDLIGCAMTLYVDGSPASTGTGRDCLGDPLLALQWLARTALQFDQPLRAGEIVLSGALGPMVPVTVGTAVTATICGLGDVACRFV
jgi:2-keto-4-pentenoate hydratase